VRRLLNAYFAFLAALTLAQRALAASEIFRRAAALILRRRRRGFRPDDEVSAAKASSRDCRRSICAFKVAMRFNWLTESLRSAVVFMVGRILKISSYNARH
jgi:hypothetical protein